MLNLHIVGFIRPKQKKNLPTAFLAAPALYASDPRVAVALPRQLDCDLRKIHARFPMHPPICLTLPLWEPKGPTPPQCHVSSRSCLGNFRDNDGLHNPWYGWLGDFFVPLSITRSILFFLGSSEVPPKKNIYNLKGEQNTCDTSLYWLVLTWEWLEGSSKWLRIMTSGF